MHMGRCQDRLTANNTWLDWLHTVSVCFQGNWDSLEDARISSFWILCHCLNSLIPTAGNIYLDVIILPRLGQSWD